MADVTVLRPAPEPYHPDCAAGCSAGARWLAGPCQHQCAKTPEFQEQCERDAEASRLRFRRSLGIGALREVPPADAVVLSRGGDQG